MTFIDASDQVMGRFASVIAKRLLQGEEIVVVNAEKILVTGDRDDILEEYRWHRRVGSQRKGPYYPSRPDMILKRAIKGMLPHKRPRGRSALKRLRVFIDVPDEYKKKKLEKIPEASRVSTESFLTLKEISQNIGAKI